MTEHPADEPEECSGFSIEVLVDDPDLAERLRAVQQDLLKLGQRRSFDRPMRVVITDNADMIFEGRLDARHIILTDDLEMEAMLRSGAAVLPRSAGMPELKLALEAHLRGLVVLPAGNFELLEATELADELRAEEGPVLLTARELEVLAALAEGASNKVIARRLEISVHTAKFHVASICQKLGAISRTDAVARAVREGILML
jgi:DNA-binding NarL/FixJ family response regulator